LVFRYPCSYFEHSYLNFHGILRREGTIAKQSGSDIRESLVFAFGSWLFALRTIHNISLSAICDAIWLKWGILEGQQTVILIS
jgi:hypothetical protein